MYCTLFAKRYANAGPLLYAHTILVVGIYEVAASQSVVASEGEKLGSMIKA